MLKITRRKGRKGWWLTGTVRGIRVRESAGTDQRSVAEEIRVKREAELIRTNLYGSHGTLTFSQATVMYLESGRDSRFLKPIILAIGERKIASLTPGEVQDLARQLYPGATASTRNRQVIAPMVAVVNFAAERGLCQSIRVRRFKETKPRTTAVDREWIEKFRLAAPNRWIGALALFMFTTGARLSEALSLTRDDIDLSSRVARVAKTKNGDPHDYYLVPEIADELRLLEPRNGRVFGYTQRRHIYEAWRLTCERAGISHVRPHQAGRHSFATEMIVRHKQDVATTAALGNWKSCRMLMERYCHPENLRETSDRVFSAEGIGTKLTPAKFKS